jgi:hypothetical protein
MAVSRTLSAKERLFAEKLADGLGPTDAYKSVYSNSSASRTAQVNGWQIAKRPRVVAEVERLRRNPSPTNYRGIKEFAVEKLLKMAESDPNPTARHRAMATLLKYADSNLQRQPAPHQPPQRTLGAHNTKLDRVQIVKELQLLYERGLGAPPPAQVRSVPDSVVDLPSEDNPFLKRDDTQLAEPEIDSGTNFGGELNARDSEAELGGQHGVDEQPQRDVSEGSDVNLDRFELRRLPGRFGRASYVRRLVR